MSKPTRTVTLPDGSKRIEEYIGKRSDLSDSDQAGNWRTVMEMGKDDVYAGMVRASADITVGAGPAGGIILIVGGVRHAVPLGQLEEAIPVIQQAIADAKGG